MPLVNASSSKVRPQLTKIKVLFLEETPIVLFGHLVIVLVEPNAREIMDLSMPFKVTKNYFGRAM